MVTEYVSVAFSDGTNIPNSLAPPYKRNSDEDANCEFEYSAYKKGTDEIVFIYGRSKKYSCKHNEQLKDIMLQHYNPNELWKVLTEGNFYKIYKILINDKVVFENTEALSDTVWDSWLNDTNASYMYSTSLKVELNEDYSLKSFSYEENYFEK